MNQYTLYFGDPKKEEEYQSENMDNIRKILLYLFSSLICFGGSIYLIFGSFKVTETLILGIGVTGYNLMAVLITYLKLINYQTLLIMCNISIILLQFLFSDYTINQSFLRGSVTMMMHCSIIYISDFPQALIQIFAMFFVKLLYVAIIEGLPFQMGIAMGLSATFLAANCYRLIKINRGQFLLRLSSNNWDDILYQVIEKRFCYFTYNSKKTCFSICQSNMFQKNQVEFIAFLRKYQIGKQTLEQYIFKDLKYFGNTERKEFKIKNGKEIQKITLISFFIESPCFIIILDNENIHLKYLNQQIAKVNKYCKSTLTMLSLVNLKFLHQGIEYQNRIKLLKLRYIYFKYIVKSSQQRIRTFNLPKLMAIITPIICIKDVNISSSNQNIQITTIYSQFLFLLIEIIEAFTSKEIEIKIDETQLQGITLQFMGILHHYKIQFGRYYQIISDNHYQIQQNKSQLTVQLNQDISYMNSPSTQRIRSPKHITIPLRYVR